MKYEEVLERSEERGVTEEEALTLFEKTDRLSRYLRLFETASRVRDANVGTDFELWPFSLSTNTGCSTDPPCRYCGEASEEVKMGTDEETIASEGEVAEAARIAESMGFPGVQLGGGCSGRGGEEAVNDSRIVKDETDLKIFVNYGYDMSEENIAKLEELGVERVGCSLETVNREIFERIKPGDSLEERKKVANLIDESDLGLASGMMIGVGESYEDRVDHLFQLKKFDSLNYTYVSGFFPIPGTPMENRPPASSLDIAKTIAIMRLVLRDVDIGGSFGRDDQLQLWMMAGTSQRNVHGMFEPKESGKGFSKRFNGERREIGDNFVFINSLPTYAEMVKEAGLKPVPAAGGG